MIKKNEKLLLSNAYVFSSVLENENLCKRVLETLLQSPIASLKQLIREKEIYFQKETKPVKLDIFVKDKKDIIYDTEMQNLNKKSIESLELPKRSRYYQSVIDSEILKKGVHYSALNDSYVIFICTFDPFGYGRYIYTFSNFCEEEKNLKLEDRTTKIFFYTKSKAKDIPENIKRLFDYIETGMAEDDLTKDLDGEVEKLSHDKRWWGEYMRSLTWLMDAKMEGREEGREEGIKILVETCCELGVDKEVVKERLIQRFSLTEDRACEFVNEYYK